MPPSFGTTYSTSLLSFAINAASPDQTVPIQASSVMNFCLILSVSNANRFGSSFCKSVAAVFNCASSFVLFENPCFLRPIPNTSRESFNKVTCPLYFSFHKSAQLVGASFTYFLLYAIPVTPQVYTKEYLFSGSNAGVLKLETMFSIFGIFFLSNGANKSIFAIVFTM
ncbi:Uncharacterised protein [Streptococcus pneumoniae]|nr:Uncharacterised protein [Streptococcus pneumoniae]